MERRRLRRRRRARGVVRLDGSMVEVNGEDAEKSEKKEKKKSKGSENKQQDE
ncbi:hypothetical protein QJS04_geneDACA023940 [Acorus gramineus]|uniref:Uncharacterized protein n=1 Tax=Acorus gramineus TaxID=55184 RepID=A0AAV9BKN4_ACOGR|nr:hypothetical protein QJS04_geneDACA023940 [Acorus gramineus]